MDNDDDDDGHIYMRDEVISEIVHLICIHLMDFLYIYILSSGSVVQILY